MGTAAGTGTRVERSDVSRLAKFSRTGAGAVRVPATVARTGVQLYGKVREYRPPEEVFHPDSLATLGSVPVTLGHPPADVNPGNVRDYQVGHVSDTPPELRVKVDGSSEEWLKPTLVVADGSVLDRIENDDASEISCGYSCRLDMTPGVTPNGEHYDGVQRDIRFNHVAILTADTKARAGAEARLRLDTKEIMKKIVIDGVEYDYGSEAHINKLQAKADAALALESARADKAEAERDAAKDRADKADAKSSTEALDKAVEARIALLQRAAKYLPATYDTKGKTDSQVRLDALTAAIGAEKVAGKTEGYLEARFDALEDTASPNATWQPQGSGTPASAPTARTDGRTLTVDNDDDTFRKSLATKSPKDEE